MVSNHPVISVLRRSRKEAEMHTRRWPCEAGNSAGMMSPEVKKHCKPEETGSVKEGFTL